MHIFTDHLKALLIVAAKKDYSRQYLCGIHVEPAAGIAVATDGHILLAVKITLDKSERVGPSFIVPREAAELAVKATRLQSHELHPEINGGRYQFMPAGVSFTPIDGTFPDWRRVIPRSYSGERAQFDPDCYGRITKALGLIGVRLPVIAHNGNSAALVGSPSNALAIIMPCRHVDIDPAAHVAEFLA